VVQSRFGNKADLFLALLEERIAERAAQNARLAEGLSGAEGMGCYASTRPAAISPSWTGGCC
jgi:AcrR family transcriptional regulator